MSDGAPPAEPAHRRGVRVHPAVDRLGAYGWRIIVIAVVLYGLLWLVGHLRLVVFPLIVAVFLTRALCPVYGLLLRRGFRPGLAAATALVGFLVALGGFGWAIGAAVSNEFDRLGPTVGQAVDDLERWVVETQPFGVDEADIERFRQQAGDAVDRALRSSGGALVSGALVVTEIVLGLLLSLILTFFLLKDGRRFTAWCSGLLAEARRPLAARLGQRGWQALGGYLRGAAVLGLVEGTIIAVTLALVGASLAVPVGLVTFVLAFVPFVGAIVSGALAVMVALATGGGPAAIIVAVVALVVQQLDNDLLAPIVYGKALGVHPAVVLLAITAGGSLFGLPGSFLAVPFTAVAVNVSSELRAWYQPERAAGATAEAGPSGRPRRRPGWRDANRGASPR
ncbi:MAG: AI-2E family transporter [Acidimicrobiia bacterium]